MCFFFFFYLNFRFDSSSVETGSTEMNWIRLRSISGCVRLHRSPIIAFVVATKRRFFFCVLLPNFFANRKKKNQKIENRTLSLWNLSQPNNNKLRTINLQFKQSFVLRLDFLQDLLLVEQFFQRELVLIQNSIDCRHGVKTKRSPEAHFSFLSVVGSSSSSSK